MKNLLLYFIITYLTTQNIHIKEMEEIIKKNDIKYLPLKKCIKTQCKKKTNKLSSELKCFDHCLKKISQKIKSSQKAFQKKLKDYPKDFCLNYRKKDKIRKKEVLLEFAKGPCSPIILAPGVMSTKLTVEINCEVLREKQPHIFKSCGWTSCGEKYHFWQSIPENEYILWIPSLSGPLSVFTISKGSNMCFANLIKPHFDFDNKPEDIIKPREGVKIRIYGFTPGTKNDRNCGGGAISNLLPLALQNDTTSAFANLIASLERIGYISGLTMQALPYNFYYSYRKNEFKLGFMKNLRKLKLYTGKKITLIGHSMGNINILHNLSLLTKEQKELYIFNYVAIAPPYLGAPKATKVLISGNDEFSKLNGYLGFHFDASVRTSSNQLSVYDLAARNPFSIYRGMDFMDKIKDRILYEQLDEVPFEESGIDFWPKKDEICHEENLVGINKYCNIGFHNFDLHPKFEFIQKDGTIEDYNFDTVQEMLNKYPISKHIPNLYKKLYTNEIALIKPGVPVFLIFNNSIKTTFKVKFSENYKTEIQNKTYPTIVKETPISGDKTVPTYSAIIPGLHWANEHSSNKTDKTSPPVKFIEYCSLAHQNGRIYDNITENGAVITKNEYIGLSCKCLEQNMSDYDACDHASMMADVNLISFLHGVVNGFQKIGEEVIKGIERLDDVQLLKDMALCRHIVNDVFEGVDRVEEL